MTRASGGSQRSSRRVKARHRWWSIYWGCIQRGPLAPLPALCVLKTLARAPTASISPLPFVEHVSRAERPPFEYSPHREFTVLVLGASGGGDDACTRATPRDVLTKQG
ncbi:hypothetical protein EV714DRAFT_278355 [Schizophyllum commune]